MSTVRYKYTIERKKPVFDRASQSLSEFIKPNAVNQGLIQRARDDFALLAVATQSAHVLLRNSIPLLLFLMVIRPQSLCGRRVHFYAYPTRRS